jgi:uncharacterized membrane protein YfcA
VDEAPRIGGPSRRRVGEPRSGGTAALIGTGLTAGFFAGMFGVGGGVVVVPMLIAFAAIPPRRAMATSLVAMTITVLAAASWHGQSGTVRWGYAVLIGVPAVIGAILGTSLQQRMHPDRLVIVFSVLVVAAAIKLAL